MHRPSYTAIASGIFVAATQCHAVIVAGTGGFGNTTAPVGVSQFNNVAMVGSMAGGSGSGIYLGNGWVLTANHVSNSNPVSFPNAPGSPVYNVVGGTTHQLHIPNTGTGIDMKVFQINGTPTLPSLTIATSAPTTTDLLYMVGGGRNRVDIPSDSTDIYYWSSGTNPWTELPSSIGADRSGYKVDTAAATRSVRWGTNHALDLDPGTIGDQTTTTVNSMTSFVTGFDTAANTGQAAEFDSGGAVLLSSGVLQGMIFAAGFYTNQPANTAVFGDATYATDLSVYRNEIQTIIGTPGLWKGASGSSWTSTSSWDNLTLPSSTTNLTFGSAAAGGTVNLDAARNVNATITLSNGSSTAYTLAAGTGGSLNLTGTTTLSVTGTHSISAPITGSGPLVKSGAGTLNLSGSNSYTGGTTVSAGKLIIATVSSSGTGALSVTNSANVTLQTGRSSPLQVSNLSVAASASVEMNDNDMIIKGQSSSYSTVSGYLFTGYASGSWNGPGVRSTTAASASNTAIGILTGQQFLNNDTLDLGTFGGQAVAANDLLLKYTYHGDSNIDGSVDDADLFLFLPAYTGSQTGDWLAGDYTYDGFVDDADLFLFLPNYTGGATGLNEALASLGLEPTPMILSAEASGLIGSAVPEPATLSLLALGAGSLLRRRRA